MKKFQVSGGVAKFGPGQELLLAPAQIETRRAVLELPKDYDGKSEAIVRTTAGVEFKVGEIVGLPELERRLVDVLVPLGKPETETEKNAVRKAEARQAEAAAADKAAAGAGAGKGKGKHK